MLRVSIKNYCILLMSAFLPLVAAAQGYCEVANYDDGLTIIRLPENATLLFTDHRPSTSEALLCIPAAFTSPEGTIQGAYRIDGHQHNSYNAHSKVSLHGNSFSLGRQFTSDNGFQQMCLVRNHKAVHFRDASRRIRRALCKESAKAPAVIVESKKALTMYEFALLLEKLMESAVYTDMGSFGYGWYRTMNGFHRLSPIYFYKKGKQTNWLVVTTSVL